MRRLACAAAVALLPTTALAAPEDGYSMSDDAALMGGAVVATGRDVASSWYNPALLAGNRRLRADVSTAAYGVRWLRAPGIVQSRVPSGLRQRPGASREFLVVPTAFAIGSRVRPHLSVGFGFFTSRFAEPTLVVRDSSGSEDGATVEIRRSAVQRRYHTGPIVGIRVHPKFHVGFAVLGVYDRSTQSQRLFLDREVVGLGQSTRLSDTDATVRSYGLEGAFGIRGQLGKWVSAGATIRTPGIVVVQTVDGSRGSVETTIDDEGNATLRADLDSFPVQGRPSRVATWRVATGLGVGNRMWTLGLDAEAEPSLNPEDPTIGTAARWNVRVGARRRLNARWTLGGGLFTDRNTHTNTSFGNARVNLWGGAFGVQMRTPVRLHRKERARKIAFRTTVGVRYAAGRGVVGGFGVDYDADTIAPTRVDLARRVDASMHLLTVHAGSGLVF
ncbi:MAG: hypothetical protein AAGA54_07240 [Myxococcota bacterium]